MTILILDFIQKAFQKAIKFLIEFAPVLSSFGTIAAFIGLFVQIRKNRKDEQFSQAKNISCWIDADNPTGSDNPLDKKSETWIALLNDSNLPIYDVIVSVDDILSSEIGVGDDRCSYCSVIPSGHYLVLTHPIDHYMNRIFNASISFRDSLGRSWTRSANGELTEVRKKTVFEIRKITLPPIETSKKRIY